jgi:hypothetical protein
MEVIRHIGTGTLTRDTSITARSYGCILYTLPTFPALPCTSERKLRVLQYGILRAMSCVPSMNTIYTRERIFCVLQYSMDRALCVLHEYCLHQEACSVLCVLHEYCLHQGACSVLCVLHEYCLHQGVSIVVCIRVY